MSPCLPISLWNSCEADYQNLGLPCDASPQEVKKQFRKLARELHPDKNQSDPKAADRFREVHDSFVAIEKRRSSRTLNGWGEWLLDWTLGKGAAKSRRHLTAIARNLLANCHWKRPAGCQGPASEPPEPGDLVLLVGKGCPPEHSGCTAVVTAVKEEHCTVAVLDEGQRFAVGNCWPGFSDVSVQSRAWRLGERVMVEGMRSSSTKGLNGCVGRIVRHPREGHPSFVCKASAPETPQLVVCVRFDEPALAGKATALLEPRFLVPYEAHLSQLTSALESASTILRKEQ